MASWIALSLYLLGVWHWMDCPTSIRAVRRDADFRLHAALAIVWPAILAIYFLAVLARGALINAARLVGAEKKITRWI